MKNKLSPKKYLYQVWDIQREIENTRDEITRQHALAQRATSTVEAIRVSGSTGHSKLENAVLNYSELCDELADNLNRLKDTYRDIAKTINAVDNPTLRQLLKLRYLHCMKWEDVAGKMGFSYVHVVHRLHPKALQQIKI